VPWSSEDNWSSLLEFWAPCLEVLKMTEVRYWNFERRALKFWRWLKFVTGILCAVCFKNFELNFIWLVVRAFTLFRFILFQFIFLTDWYFCGMQCVYWNKTRIYNISRVGGITVRRTTAGFTTVVQEQRSPYLQGGGENRMCKQCTFVAASTDTIAMFKLKTTAFFGDVIPRSLVEI
jgi:hypothetical protein